MTMCQRSRPYLAAACTAAAVLCFGAAAGYTQDGAKPSDEALDKLLEKLDAEKTPDAPRPPQDAPKAGGPEAKKDDPAPTKDSRPPGAQPKGSQPPGELTTQDQALDNLLEKLGTTDETPAPRERARGPAQPGEKPGQGKGEGKPAPGELKGQVKDLDEHLEELLGRRRKKKDQEQEKGGEESGPLSKVIKEMREVEGRLGKPDTGEETRKKQAGIVKDLDTLIEQLRSMSNSSQSRSRMRLVMQPGQKPGSQSGQSQGANGGNAPMAKPARPDGKRALVGDKNEWGHLPDALRQELENVDKKEEPLPTRRDLVERYYLSVSKKKLTREE
jgi:hypothetical protein